MCHNEICVSKCCKYVLRTIQILRNSEWSRKSFGTRGLFKMQYLWFKYAWGKGGRGISMTEKKDLNSGWNQRWYNFYLRGIWVIFS